MLDYALEFSEDVAILLADPIGLVLAFGLVTLVRRKWHAFLIILNLGLFLELVTLMVDPGYRFASFLAPRMMASALQVGVALGVAGCWRLWRASTTSVTAH